MRLSRLTKILTVASSTVLLAAGSGKRATPAARPNHPAAP